MLDKNSIWGGAISIGLHIFVLTFFFKILPAPTYPDEKEYLNVELVEPVVETPSPSLANDENHEAILSDETSASRSFEKSAAARDDFTDTQLLKRLTDVSAASAGAEESKDQQGDDALSDEAILRAERSNVNVSLPQETMIKMQAAKQIFSDRALSDPRVKQALGTLTPKQRVSQICSIEALEQIRHARPDTPPDMMARKVSELTETSLKMRGGAFRSHAKWYDVHFTCEVDLSDMKVSSFNYKIGNLILESDWSQRGLLAD